MAQARRFCCNRCSHAIKAWDEGDPYYLDEQGTKHYAFHPDPRRNRCIGVDSPHLCLDCGASCKVDSRQPISTCPDCGSVAIANCWDLQGHSCPFCRQGQFQEDTDFVAIS